MMPEDAHINYVGQKGGENILLNYIWFFMLTAGVVFGVLNGKANEVSQAFVTSAGKAVELAVGLLGVMCLWSGIMRIMEKSGATARIAKYARPLTGVLFPEIRHRSSALGAILMNLSANFLGLGNAATPLGLKAMEKLQRLNPKKDTASDSMCMFLVLNTAAVQLIPVTVIAVREQAGSSRPHEIMITVWIASICASLAGVAAAKFFAFIGRSGKLSGRSRKP
jgi:spore maturation protein A